MKAIKLLSALAQIVEQNPEAVVDARVKGQPVEGMEVVDFTFTNTKDANGNWTVPNTTMFRRRVNP